MSEDQIFQLGADAIRTVLYIAGPLLLAAMVVGIVISVLQAVTQINEATLTFIPKMIAIILVLALMAPWMLEVLKNYTTDVIGQAGDWVR